MEGGEAAMAVSEGIERAESRNAKPPSTQSTRRKASAIAALSVVNGHPGGAVIRGSNNHGGHLKAGCGFSAGHGTTANFAGGCGCNRRKCIRQVD